MKNKHDLQFTGFEEDLECYVCGGCSRVFFAKTKEEAKKEANKMPCHDHREIEL